MLKNALATISYLVFLGIILGASTIPVLEFEIRVMVVSPYHGQVFWYAPGWWMPAAVLVLMSLIAIPAFFLGRADR